MITSQLSSKGQTTILTEIRNALELDPGDRLAYEIREGEIVIHPLAGDVFDHKGTVEPSQRPDAYHAAMADAEDVDVYNYDRDYDDFPDINRREP